MRSGNDAILANTIVANFRVSTNNIRKYNKRKQRDSGVIDSDEDGIKDTEETRDAEGKDNEEIPEVEEKGNEEDVVSGQD